MTASWIAKELGATEVSVNYLASEYLSSYNVGKPNPLPRLEFSKSKYDFNQMKQDSPEYATENWFPNGVNIIDCSQADKDNEKPVIFKTYPENDF